MAVQNSQQMRNSGFIFGQAFAKENAVIQQNVSRSGALAQYTVMAKASGVNKYVPLRTVDATELPAKMQTGALGCTLNALQGITDGEFAITVDGVSINVTGLDFSDIDAPKDTAASMVTGALGCNLATLQGVTTGDFAITVDGEALTITGLDFSAITTLDDAAQVIEFAAAGKFSVIYDDKTTKFRFIGKKKGRLGAVSALSDTGGAGADISGSGFLNGRTGTAVLTAGSGGIGATIASVINEKAAGRFVVERAADDDAFVFISPESGQGSSVSALAAIAGGAGTDISGSGYLNGRTGTANLVTSTGFAQENVPIGIYLGPEITEAAIIAGDVEGCTIATYGNCVIDRNQIVLENSLTLNTVVVGRRKTIEDCLVEIGLVPEYTTSTSEFENA